MLDGLIADLARRGQARDQVAAAVQQVALLERAAHRLAAERTLVQVLGRIATTGLRRTVLDGGPEVADVLHRLLDHAQSDAWADAHPEVPREWLAGLVAELGESCAVAPTTLNARELAILRMVGSGRSNQQIANSMTVTVNTVKWYLKNIYTKLGATNRTEATAIARQEGLLA
ncbi:MAG TPA: LuxR C-terminal-related transcriptional regulator [Nakamurella sp.]